DEDLDDDGQFDTGDLNGNGLLDQSGGFVDIGYINDNAVTMYSEETNGTGAKTNTSYGPVNRNTSDKNVFDTWHPDVMSNNDPANPPPTTPITSPSTEQPPFLSRNPTNDPNGTPEPLRAIQITVRFFDVTSQQTRDVTLVHHFVK
ncbi:MAG: hypothetical protein ACREIV_03905, partial [Planctomycetaceae bacterium]